jgi:hypothetical protein
MLTGNTQTQVVEPKITWGYCSVNPITQVIEHFYNQRKKN